MYRLLPLALLALILFIPACKEPEPEEPPPPPPPPPPSAESLATQEKAALADMLMSNATFSKEEVEARINNTKNKLRSEVNGERALKMITNDVRDALKAARDNGSWDAVLTLCDALETLDPSDPRLARYRERAALERNKPTVKIRAFHGENDGRVMNVLVDVTTPETGETHRMTVREGEEFHNLKFVNIIGANKGIVLEYMPTAETFEVLK